MLHKACRDGHIPQFGGTKDVIFVFTQRVLHRGAKIEQFFVFYAVGQRKRLRGSNTQCGSPRRQVGNGSVNLTSK